MTSVSEGDVNKGIEMLTPLAKQGEGYAAYAPGMAIKPVTRRSNKTFRAGFRCSIALVTGIGKACAELVESIYATSPSRKINRAR
ncbi:MAG: hypothetical protein U0165_01210 [Polyangiaceae bacterium]